jgi:16S rRNA (guanine1207-N2)-methyltransferase
MTEHYYTKKPESFLKVFKIETSILGNNLKFESASGLFSKEHIDNGTLLLINNAIIEKNDEVLDLGCGYGVVGISISKLYGVNMTFSDINERAIEFSKNNCILNNIKNFKVIQSDNFENIKEKFNVILLNPPQTAGKEICFEMIKESKSHLNSNGTLQLVARPNKGGETLAKKMKEVYGNVSEIGKGNGFKVYLSRL